MVLPEEYAKGGAKGGVCFIMVELIKECAHILSLVGTVTCVLIPLNLNLEEARKSLARADATEFKGKHGLRTLFFYK